MKHCFLVFVLLQLFQTANASICTWSGPAMGNWSEPANWSCGHVPGASDTVQLSGQSLVLNDSVAIQSLILNQNCSIAGTGTLLILGKMEVKNGGNQTFLVKIISTGQLEAQMATLNFNARPFVLAGTAHFTKGIFWMKDGGVFEIAPTGVATFQDQTNFYSFTSYFGFVVRGTIFKTGASNMDFESLFLFKNANINIQTGYLVNYYYQSPVNCIIDSSNVNIAAGAYLRIERIIEISNSTVAGAGKIWIGIGSCRFVHPNTILAEIEQRSGGCSGFNGVDTLANYTLLGGLLGSGLQIGGNLNWVKGNTNSLLVEGFTSISDTTIASINQKNIAGTLSVQGGGKYTGNDQLSGTVKIPTDAVFSLDANPAANFKADLQIFGTLQKLNTSSVSVGFVVNNGRIEGLGTLDGLVVGAGTVAPGLDTNPGTLTMKGPNLFLQAESKIEIQMAQSGASDLLNLLGRCKLTGTLNVLESGNAPAGDYVVIQASDSLTGNFSVANLPPNWELIQHPFNITLRKLPTPPVAQFSIQTPVLCVPAMVQFVDASTGDALNYTWAFPGGNPAASTEKNPLVTYALAGQYTATLTLSNALGSSAFTQDFIIHPTVETTLAYQICVGDSVEFNGQYYSLPGVYQAILQTQFGCDSLVQLQLSNISLDYSLQQTDTSLIVNALNASLQWLDCADFSPIPGATSAVFAPSVSGNYALQITQNGCSEISNCYPMVLVGTASISSKQEGFQVMPNPAADFVQIRWESADAAPDAVYVYDLRGVQMARLTDLNWIQQVARLDLRILDSGIYFLVLENEGLRVGMAPVMVE